VVLPAYKLREADALVQAAVGTALGDEYVFIDVRPTGDSMVHVGRCPGDASYLAAFSVDEAGAMHLLCLEYVAPESYERVPAEDLGFFQREERCRGPRAWHGLVTGTTTATWSASTWLADLCGPWIRHNVVLAVAAGAPMVTYCAFEELACAWRITLLGEGHANRALVLDVWDGVPPPPYGFFVKGDTLFSIVAAKDPSERLEFGYELVSLDNRDRLRRRAITLTPAPVKFEAFPHRGTGRSPWGMTSWASDDPSVLETLLPLWLMERPSLDVASAAQRFSVRLGHSPTGFRSLGPELLVLPLDDGETDSARIEFPGPTTVTLSELTLHWLRATCSGACVATYSSLGFERSAAEVYPATFWVLRTGVSDGLPGRAECEAHPNGDLTCHPQK
jgi:hypothetical protein